MTLGKLWAAEDRATVQARERQGRGPQPFTPFREEKETGAQWGGLDRGQEAWISAPWAPPLAAFPAVNLWPSSVRHGVWSRCPQRALPGLTLCAPHQEPGGAPMQRHKCQFKHRDHCARQLLRAVRGDVSQGPCGYSQQLFLPERPCQPGMDLCSLKLSACPESGLHLHSPAPDLSGRRVGESYRQWKEASEGSPRHPISAHHYLLPTTTSRTQGGPHTSPGGMHFSADRARTLFQDLLPHTLLPAACLWPSPPHALVQIPVPWWEGVGPEEGS